jgi:hypothetical protein
MTTKVPSPMRNGRGSSGHCVALSRRHDLVVALEAIRNEALTSRASGRAKWRAKLWALGRCARRGARRTRERNALHGHAAGMSVARGDVCVRGRAMTMSGHLRRPSRGARLGRTRCSRPAKRHLRQRRYCFGGQAAVSPAPSSSTQGALKDAAFSAPQQNAVIPPARPDPADGRDRQLVQRSAWTGLTRLRPPVARGAHAPTDWNALLADEPTGRRGPRRCA